MITNLFSSFDPSTSTLSLSWTIFFMLIPLTVTNTWYLQNSFNNINNNLTQTFKNEVNFSLNNTENSVEILILTLFFFILYANITALYPQIFSSTSHLLVNLPLALTFWLSVIILNTMNNTNHFLSHLLPQGTPLLLINFIVLIELVSNLIRPITLCVRLTANLIAGHLLITLLGNAISNLSMIINIFSIIAPITLTILESAVAAIQAYVFITLITLYISETN